MAVFGLRPVDADQAMQRMASAAPHQGSKLAQLGLGICRLGTLSRADKPSASLSRAHGLIAGFAGRLDNLNDLVKRVGLTAEASPAQIVLQAFVSFGETAPSMLRGAYAAAISDGTRLWCFRDHVGFDRLFYRHYGGTAFVASEPKQVIAGAGIRREPDPEIVEAIFYADYYDERRCALAGVERVPRSHLVSFQKSGVADRRYWDPSSLLETSRISAEEVPERFDHLMTQAASRALDAPSSIALSGGIDSPTVAAYAAPVHRKILGRSLTAFSEVYPDFPDSDEASYTEEVARSLDIPLHTYVPAAQHLERLGEWVELFDTPWPIWSPEGAVERYRQAQSLGFSTILTGFVAEEVVGTTSHTIPHYLWRGRLGPLARSLDLHRKKGSSTRWVVRQLLSILVPKKVMVRRRLKNPLVYAPDWVDMRRVYSNYALGAAAPRSQWREHQLGMFIGVGTSGEADRICQEWTGVRVRAPWADVDLWEFFLSLPAEIKNPDLLSKGLIRQLARGRVPDRILDRRDKTVMNQWFEKTSIDYPTLRKLLVNPPHRLAGVDYDMLAQRVEGESLDLPEYLWAKDLATAQAFLGQW